MSQNSAPTEGIMKKIKALMDKANSTDSLPEKEAFMLGAQRLLAEYNLEYSEVIRIGEDGVVKEDEILYSEKWEQKLMGVICSNNFCKCIGNGYNKLFIIGKPANIAVCIYLFKFYSNALVSESMSHYTRYCADELIKFMSKKSSKKKDMSELDNILEGLKDKFLHEFMIGGCQGISDKMYDQKQDQMRNNTNFNTLVRVNDSDVETYVKKHFPNLTSARGLSANKHGSGYASGYKVGKDIDSYSAVTSGAKQIR